MDAATRELIGLGVAGAVLILIIFGILGPKWVMEEYRTRIAIQDRIIERLTDALQRLADKTEARAVGREANDEDLDR